ncbi:MAG: acyl-CoA dehydrogenase [Rhodothermales bacterium]
MGTMTSAGFDIQTLTDLLDGDEVVLRRRVRERLCQPDFQVPRPLDKEAFREIVLGWVQAIANEGWGALAYPEAHGGSDNLKQFITVAETLGFHDLNLFVKFGVQFGLFGGAVHQLGTEQHHAEYLPDVGTLALPGCFAMTERSHGSNVRELETTATYDTETKTFFVETPRELAHKEYIGNAAAHGQMSVVFAQLITQGERHGVHAFLVPIRTAEGTVLPGIRIEDSDYKLGLNGIDNGRIWYDSVRIPRENLLDRFGSVASDGTYSSPIESEGKRFFSMLGTLVGGRISVGAAALNATKVGLTIAIKYANRRRQFGPKEGPDVLLMDYLTHQRRLLPLLARTYALHFTGLDLADRFANRTPDTAEEVETMASAFKAMATWHTTNALQECREACGGQGYLAVNRFAELKADSDIFTTFEGDNTVLMLQVSKSLLSAFRQSFQDMRLFGMVQYVAQMASERLRTLNPITARLATTEHLHDPEFHRDALAYRERRLLVTAAQRMKQRLDDGVDPFHAFIECQDHLVKLGEAFAEHLALMQFQTAIATLEEGDVLREVLQDLCTLYALHALDADAGWFMASGGFEGVKAKAIRDEINALCGRLRPHAEALVEGFGLPDELIRVPIATYEE